MYSKTILVGNLTKDIELRYLPTGSALAKSSIATSYKYKTQSGEQKDEVCFLDFNMFGRSAEIANQYLKKGSKVLLEGRLIFEQWTANDGSARSKHALRVDEMKMLDSKPQNPQQQQYQPQQQQYQPQQQYNQNPPIVHQNNHSQRIPEINIDESEVPF